MRHAERTDLIDGLNEDLAHEYASVIQYRTFASAVRGPHRPTLRPLFTDEINDELGHAEMLADFIVALGGAPTMTPTAVRAADDAEAMLRSVLEAESAAVDRYVERRRLAEALGEHALVVALDEVIGDETRHRNELRLLLDGWSGGAAARYGEGSRTGRKPSASPEQPRARVADDRPDDVPIAARGRDRTPGRTRER